ncbi:MAG TPA: hypothetical protein VF746_21185 [Longimicrobium sp.]|jgi:hypothetical protein
MLLLGTHVHPAEGDAARRQAAALDTLRGLDGVRLVNLQWPDGVIDVPGFRTVASLRADSVAATGRAGRRKPLVTELFDGLCACAEEEGLGAFCFTNSDVHVSQALVDEVLAVPLDGRAVSRMDFDGATGAGLGVVTRGVDTFAVRAEWWRAHRRRFRPYVVGEAVWDNVYAAILLSHGDARLLNRGTWTRHERHATAWTASPFADYTRLLAALDRPYFSLWARYHAGLVELRARGAPDAEEDALQRRVFRFRPSPAERAVQAGRALKARLRYAASRAGRRP